jgi:tetratricopeptide (TPR) repeat protein
MTRLKLPTAPRDQTGTVKAWSAPTIISTYHPLAPDKNPMFLEKRVYQGSSGRVYPLPFTDRIAIDAREHTWQAVHIENEFIRVMVLPEIGGRVHVGLDKKNGYDFFYRQNVIKPALVGLAGPWISGGVEFNWPQHHRPATFMPMDWQIESHSDGSQTIWCSDHDPMNRLKGMHGICLHPGRSYIEVKVRLYNRTPFVQTFLWWANVATHVHELYQSFFPPNVFYVADHARRAMSRFPLCTGHYYGVDYGERARSGVPADEMPAKFIPPGSYSSNDLSWYANIPVPTSYMAIDSQEDFHGGYDHKVKAGVVLIADHHVAPGKKQWTWGNHEFGYAWDRNLTDEDGPYIELMSGVYTDNQPDFSFLGPGETKVFSQYWYPIREIGPPQKANADGAVSLMVSSRDARLAACVTQAIPGARMQLNAHGRSIAEWTEDITPDAAFLKNVELPLDVRETDLTVVLSAGDERELLRYTPSSNIEHETPTPASEPLDPEEISGTDELYVTGLHLEQYRHATRLPEAYWGEALRRDPNDSRCNNAMGVLHMRRGEFGMAEACYRKAIRRLVSRNSNPYEGEPYYNLGLTLRYMGRDEEAYAAFFKSTWNQAWGSAAYFALAQLDAKRSNWTAALEHLRASLRMNTEHLAARNLLVLVSRELGNLEDAETLLRATRTLDPMDTWARHLANGTVPIDNQMLLDLAIDYAACGFVAEAISVLAHADKNVLDGSFPMILYAKGYYLEARGDVAAARTAYAEASTAAPDYCFPVRPEEAIILQAAVAANPEDPRAAYYLGNLLYDRRRHNEAIELWERASLLDSSYSVVWRNLGIAYFNIFGSAEKARRAFDKAIQVNPQDARVFYERDQLWKRIGEAPERRLQEFDIFGNLVCLRDDLSVELASLYNQTGQPEKALALLQSRKFQPWEGGEGRVLGQHVRTHLALGRRALMAGDATTAQSLFSAALKCPSNLGEAAHLLANQSDIFYWLGMSIEATGDSVTARRVWKRAAERRGDFQEMSPRPFSEMTYYNALGLKRLRREAEADELLHDLLVYAERLLDQPVKVEYFATSLPAMLLFEDDLQMRNTVTATFLQAQAWLGQGQTARAQELLNKVLLLDRNHARAADLLTEIETLPTAE